MHQEEHEGQCGLCRQIRLLQNSHLLPKSIYALASKAYSEQSGLLDVVSEQGVYTLPRQVTKYFLCDECEAVFDKYGENIVVKELCKIRDEAAKFKLLDKLNSVSGIVANDNSIEWYFFTDNDLVNVDAYIHFILGIIWKMSATRWREFPYSEYFHTLGDYYEEQIRHFLQTRDKCFLTNIHIICLVDNKPKSYPWIILPQVRKSDCFLYTFTVPGVAFRVWVGKKFPPEFSCLFPNDLHIRFGKTDLNRDSDVIRNLKMNRQQKQLQVRKKKNKAMTGDMSFLHKEREYPKVLKRLEFIDLQIYITSVR